MARAGDDIDTFCRRCGLDLAHIIIAMKGARPARVECKTCHNPHVYRAAATAASAPARAGARPRAPARERPASATSLEMALAGRPGDEAPRYRPASRYQVGDLLAHPTFAVGVVRRVLGDDKVEVLFAGSGGVRQPGQMRVLVHDRRQN